MIRNPKNDILYQCYYTRKNQIKCERLKRKENEINIYECNKEIENSNIIKIWDNIPNIMHKYIIYNEMMKSIKIEN